MIITVGGSIGSGKSTLAKRLAKELGFEYHSVGEAMRSLAKEKGISLIQMSMMAEKDPSIDRELDEKQKEIAKGDCVMDSRLGAYLLDADFRIWLDASPKVQVERIARRDKVPIADAELLIARREASEAERFRKIYGIDVYDQSVYDLVVDTDNMSKDKVLKKCLDAINN
jgi:cytidylate kinase